MIIKKRVTLIVPLFCITMYASANEKYEGSYVGVDIGLSQSASTDNYISLDADGLGYNFYGGYHFNRIVGIEANYNDYGNMEHRGKKLMAPISTSISANLGYTFENTIRPFALIGLGYVNLRANSESLLEEDSGLGLHFGVGVEYSPIANLTIRAITQADGINVDKKPSNLSQTDSNLSFGSTSVGLSYKF
ncbi:porin family protein [Vibrio sp. TRT 1302]|uniref:porin family protein n=1 Tax=Vibrio sp. TRT 1302 TaxID=3418504 RepID=UPI003CE7722F